MFSKRKKVVGEKLMRSEDEDAYPSSNSNLNVNLNLNLNLSIPGFMDYHRFEFGQVNSRLHTICGVFSSLYR